MSNFWLLLKTSIINNLGINKLFAKFKKKHGRSSVIIISILTFLGILVLLGFMSFYFFVYGTILEQVNNEKIILLLGIAFGAFFMVLSTVTKANGYLFRTKDFDMLMSMPIKPQAIVASKILSLTILNYLTFSFIYIPSLIVYGIFVETTVIFWLLAVLVLLITPLLPISIFSFLAYIIGHITAKMRHKNILSIILFLIFFVGIMAFSMASSTVEENPALFADGAFKIAKNMYYPGYMAYLGLQGDWMMLLEFLAINILPFIIFIYVIGKFYVKINSRLGMKAKSKGFKVEEIKTSKEVSAARVIFRKELKRYFSLPMYVVNTIGGPLIIPIIMVLLYFQQSSMFQTANEQDLQLLQLFMIAFAFLGPGISPTTSSSISLEGKQFWIIKSAPVRTKDVFIGKMAITILITVPFIIIGAFIGLFLYKFDITTLIIFIIIGSISAILSSALGLYMNVLKPKFNWDAEIKVVKQSASVLFTILLSFILDTIVVLPGVLLYIANGNLIVTLLLMVGSGVVLTAIVLLLLFTHGKNKYERISA